MRRQHLYSECPVQDLKHARMPGKREEMAIDRILRYIFFFVLGFGAAVFYGKWKGFI